MRDSKLTCSPRWCIEKIKGKRSAPTFTPSEPVHFPDCWVAHMKGTRVAGQRADSAAGYCPSKTLSYSENIMIHLYIFSSQPYTHSHTQTCAHIDTRTPTHTHTHSHPHCQMSEISVWGLKAIKKRYLHIIGGPSAHRESCRINIVVHVKSANPWRFPSFLWSAFSPHNPGH